MKFNDKDTGLLIWESMTGNIPTSYFEDNINPATGSGTFFLITGKEKSYIKDFGDPLRFFVELPNPGDEYTYTLDNDTSIHARCPSAHNIVLQLFDQYGDGYPWNGLFSLSSSDYPDGVWRPNKNIMWQPDGKGAIYIMNVERRLDSQGGIESYYIFFQKTTYWTDEQLQVHYNFFSWIPTDEDETSEPEGGDGERDLTSTVGVGFPPLPDIGFIDSHMIHAYGLTQAQAVDFSNWFWTQSVWQTIHNNIFGSPIESIMSFGILPVQPSLLLSTTRNIVVGFNQSNTATGYLINSDWRIMDFGKFFLPETWGSYIDYTNSKLAVYLPYIGIKELDISEVMSSELHLKYYINVITGDCTAFIKVSKDVKSKSIAALNSVLYSYTGNMLVHVPLTAADFSQRISTILNAGAAASSMGSALSYSASLLTGGMKPSITKTGNLGEITGYMGIQIPFIVLTRPSQSIPDAFNEIHGRMSMVTRPLKLLQGLTQVYDCKLDGINATDKEKQEIRTILQSGVIV